MAKSRFVSGLPPRKPAESPTHATTGERLQKVLSAAGIGSRRKCEELIQEGRVEIDGKVVTALGTKVDTGRQQIIVDGEPLKVNEERICYLVNKPTGVVSTNHDPSGRRRVIDLIPDATHLYTVGRLDLYSEGLILVTNDGDLTNRLAHPGYGVEKTYQALVLGEPDEKILARLRKGIRLAEGTAHCKEVTVKAHPGSNTLLEIVLDEGRNREIRRVLARVGHKVLKLKRTAIGSLKIGELLPGEWRKLTVDEIHKLYASAAEVRTVPAKKKAAKSRSARPKLGGFAGKKGAPPRRGERPGFKKPSRELPE